LKRVVDWDGDGQIDVSPSTFVGGPIEAWH